MMEVMDSPFGVDNLLYSLFLNYSVKVVKILSENLQYRDEGITFFCFDFRIDPTQEDACINQ